MSLVKKYQKMLTLLILAVHRTSVIYELRNEPCSHQSLFKPSDRASQCRIWRSEVQFIMGTQNFFLSHTCDKTIKCLSLKRGSSFKIYLSKGKGKKLKWIQCTSLVCPLALFFPCSTESSVDACCRRLGENRRIQVH